LGIENKPIEKICKICGKPINPRRTLSPLEGVCEDCWDYLYGPIGKKIKEKWTELFRDLGSDLSKSKDLSANSEAEKRRFNSEICSANNRISELEERITSLSAKLAKMRCREFGIEKSEKFGISTLYHITPIENIPSIFQYGLLSFNQVKKRKLESITCSNLEIQGVRASIPVGDGFANDYVPLFFSEKNATLAKMEYNEKNLGKVIVYICIKREIIGNEGVWFSDGNVASGQKTRHYNNLEDLEKLDWITIRAPYNSNDSEAKRIKAAEVLVPSPIDPSWFQKLIVPDQEAKSSLEKLLPYPITVEVKSEFYFTLRGKRWY
jgi:hypothetical protein